MKKMEWEKPELIVLVRGRLEENVLKICKAPSARQCVKEDGSPNSTTSVS
jgi:hypothetical protein